MLNITKNFEWSDTDRRVNIFIPNRGRGNYIRANIGQFAEIIKDDRFLIVIGNDGADDNFDDLKDKNVRYLTLNHGLPERNGCFIRNYFIKNSKCDVLLQKDPETIISPIEGDNIWIEKVANLPLKHFWRPKYTFEISEEDSKSIVDNILKSGFENLDSINYMDQAESKVYNRVHWAYAVQRDVLQFIRGYDEDYKKYGPEDRDIYDRLAHLGFLGWFDDSCVVSHVYHPIDPSWYYDGHYGMKLYQLKKAEDYFRNIHRNWGMGE